MGEIDLWRAAATLMKHYGSERAILTATRPADELRNQGDVGGFNAGKRIVKAINDLERTKPSAGETLN